MSRFRSSHIYFGFCLICGLVILTFKSNAKNRSFLTWTTQFWDRLPQVTRFQSKQLIRVWPWIYRLFKNGYAVEVRGHCCAQYFLLQVQVVIWKSTFKSKKWTYRYCLYLIELQSLHQLWKSTLSIYVSNWLVSNCSYKV